MNTEVIAVDPASPDPAVVGRAAQLLRAGRLVAFPTETVYGLGASALDPAAVRGVFVAKGRPPSNPLIVHLADATQVGNVAAEWPDAAARLAARFWPGPLTIVVPKQPCLPDEVTAGGATVAVRCPDHAVARALIRAAGVPLAAPSANRSTELSPTRAEHVLKGLGGRIDLILDGGRCRGGIESTVVDATGPVVRLLRPGLITVPMLEEVVGRVEVASREPSSASRERARPGEVARSPGQMAKHYSPRTPVVLTTPEKCLDDLDAARRLHRRIGFVHFHGDAFGRAEGYPTGGVVRLFTLPIIPELAAAFLYDALHQLDQSGLDRLVIELPPDTPEWAAVRDRLTRAASPG